MFIQLEPIWVGRTVVLVGGGPSAASQPLHRLQGSGFIVVAINDAVLHMPWADVVFSIDRVWMRNRVAAIKAFAGEKLFAVPSGTPEFAGENQVVRLRATGLSRHPARVFTGDNSGFAALGMALARGADKVILVGYDMRKPGHWHAGYSWASRPAGNLYARWARGFTSLASVAERRGQTVINTNFDSAIRAFPFASLESCLEGNA